MPLIEIKRHNAKRTIRQLMRVHEQTIRDIDGGKKFWKHGEDVTHDVRTACRSEIVKCQMVHDALDKMHDGQIKEAAALCDQIQEFVPRVH